jgi:hypothetical protein
MFPTPSTSKRLNTNHLNYVARPTEPAMPQAKGPYEPHLMHLNKPHPRALTKLKQIQYRSYQATIQIYHYRATYLSLPTFRALLNRQKDGYIDTLVSTDTLRTEQVIPVGDELPAGCIEVAYLPRVFPKTTSTTSGCALGFSLGNNVIEWLCFDRPIEPTILSCWVFDETTRAVHVEQSSKVGAEVKLFDLVGFLGKGIDRRRVRGGNAEHKLWHDGLWAARRRSVRLRLTWRNFKVEWREWREKERLREASKVLEESDEAKEVKEDSGNVYAQCRLGEVEEVVDDESEDDTMSDLSD